VYESYTTSSQNTCPADPLRPAGNVIAATKLETVVWAHKTSAKRAPSLPFFGRVAETLNWFLFFCSLKLLNAFGREPNTEHRHVRARRFPKNVYIASPLAQSRATLVLNFLWRNLKKNSTLW